MHKQRSKKLLKAVQNTCKLFDLYGQNVNLFINKKPKFYSTFSGIMSIGVIFIIIYAFQGFISSWVNREKMVVISSSISLGVSELLTSNKTYAYEFDYTNYYVYFIVEAFLPNGTLLRNEALSKYVTYNYTYFSNDFIYEPLQWEYCQVQYQDVFLGLDEDTQNQDKGKINKNRICVRDSFQMGLFPDPVNQRVNQPEFYFSVYPCINSTNNNNSCASAAEQDEMMNYLVVQTSIPTTLYDFRNSQQPQKTFYDYQNIKLDKSLVKEYSNGIIPTLLYTDYGLIYDDYRLIETSFNPKISYDPKVRQQSDPYFVFDFMVDQNFQMYYQRNQKINEIMGSLGGLLNAIFLIGKLVCYTYNSLYLKFKIIKATFSNYSKGFSRFSTKEVFPKAKLERGSVSTAIMSNFSCCNYLFPSKEVRNFYQKGAKHLHEYLDIRKIIKRLQDIDKLKMVLLSENQRRLFEYIPKPDVVDSAHKISLDSVLKYKPNLKTRKTIKDFSQEPLGNIVQENDPVDRRIFEFLDPLNYVKPETLESID